MNATRTRRRVIVDDSALAAAIGGRIRQLRLAAHLTQQALAGDRYTKAYISALENGLAKPSMAALNYLAPRLGTTASAVIANEDPIWLRLEADLHLAAGDWTEALDAYRTLLDEAVERGARADIQGSIAECLCRLDRPGEAIRPASDAADAYAASERWEDWARASYWLASAQHQVDNTAEARSVLGSVIERVRGGLKVAPDFLTRMLVAAAQLETAAGSPSTALSYLEEARGHGADLDDRRRAAFLSSLAVAFRERGDTEGAIRTGLQAVALFRASEEAMEIDQVENHLALAYLANGNIERARELARTARRGAEDRGDTRLAAHVADTEAMIALESGDAEAAVTLAGEAIALASATDSERATLTALMTRAKAYSALGRHEEASADFEAAAAAAATGRPGIRREVLSAWADTLAALGQHDRAFALAREALSER
jgi:transcriptional regulator with XRE-family HTH domain